MNDSYKVIYHLGYNPRSSFTENQTKYIPEHVLDRLPKEITNMADCSLIFCKGLNLVPLK